MVKKTTKHYVEYLGIGTVQNREERYIEETGRMFLAVFINQQK